MCEKIISNQGVDRSAKQQRCLVPVVRRTPAPGHAQRWASRRIRSPSLNARMFAGTNRLLSASAGSVCVTSPPALISSQYWCAGIHVSVCRSRDASRWFVVMRAAVVSGRERTVVRFALCWRQWLRSPRPTRRWFGPSACGVRPHSFHVGPLDESGAVR